MKLKRLLSMLTAVVLCISMFAAPVAAEAASEKTAGEYFKTSIDSYKDEVSVSIKLERNSKLTSGKVVLYYDPSVLRADWYSDDDSLGLVDVNTNYDVPEDKTGMAAISYAWASDSAIKSASSILTVEFTAKNAKNGDKISVETAVLEAYNADGAVALSSSNTVSKTTISLPKTLIGKIISWLDWLFRP